MDKAIWKLIEQRLISRRQLQQALLYRQPKRISKYRQRLIYGDSYIDQLLERFIHYSNEQIASMIYALELDLDRLLDSQYIQQPL